MDAVSELQWRGLIADATDLEGIRKLPSGSCFYVGFDPTASSLQVGNLVPLISALHLARCGLKPLILFGGATGYIGDPSGKRSERQFLSPEDIHRNVSLQVEQARKIFSRVGVEAEFVNNYDWTKSVTFLDFLRDTGKYFTVNYMLQKESVKTRLEGDGISFTEFSYMLMQAFDFYHLYSTKSCKLQVGGSDQWGNITSGLELIRKKGGSDAYALSFPLLLNSDGKKFGKSESGTMWLDPSTTSPYKFHQFWLNVEDKDVVRYLKIFTFLTEVEILVLEERIKSEPQKREAQIVLADLMCELIHGKDACINAKRSASVLFGGSIEGLSANDLLEIFAEVPSSSLPRVKAKGLDTPSFIVESGFIKSKSEVRRLITSGGLYINNERVSEATPLNLDGELVILRSGKKNYHLVKLT